MDSKLLLSAPRAFAVLVALGASAFGAIGWAVTLPQPPEKAPTPQAASASRARVLMVDDRQVLQAFLAGQPVTQRRLLNDLDRTEWRPPELRAALLKVYAVRVDKVSAFLDSAAGRSLIARHVQGWSPWTPAHIKEDALRSAILEASRFGALSASAAVGALPVRFELPQTAAEARRVVADAVCPAQCGDSVLAHWAFLVASVQVGAMGR